MDAFVRRLVESLFDKAQPLSRNRHFHTFDNVEGRAALRIYRRLTSLLKDLTASHRAGRRIDFVKADDRYQVTVEQLNGRRVTMIERAELELLLGLAGDASWAANSPLKKS